MSPPLAQLLVVDDEAAQMQALCSTLEAEGYTATGFRSASKALDALRRRSFDVLLTDLEMPEMDGIALLSAARAIDPHIAVVMMTGHGSIDTAVRAMQDGALDYILKPFRLNAILPAINRALTIRSLRMQNEELERRILERTRELEIANKDLESFSYSVSHDLRAPLRVVDGFCQAFLQDYGGGIPEEGRRLLENARAGAQRMSQLIEDLLQFARFSRQPLNAQSVQMSALVRRVLRDLQAREPQRQIEIRLHELPDCRCDPALIEQVVVNLLSNAFKFTARRAPALIEIGAFEQDGEQVYFVRDNGAGFNMQYIGRLFGVFQRLHGQQDFPGTGIGLSIVQRIVQRHGGRAWAEGDVDRGATFYFSLPIAH